MKIEVKENEQKCEVLEFPVLMKSKAGGGVVFFTSSKTGMKVQGDDVGEYSACWVDANNTNAWEKLNGSVTLTNE